ncbi:hypothetical protein ES703_30274 [subsurface metagenome]
MIFDVHVTCPVRDCPWYNRYDSQIKATEALVLHCLGKHGLPQELVRRFRRHWINSARAYRGWSTALSDIDRFMGLPSRDSGLSTESQKKMEAYLGIR